MADDTGAPASIRVSARDETRPAVLATRTGELVLMERDASARRASASVAPRPATPKPPRLLSNDALARRRDRPARHRDDPRRRRVSRRGAGLAAGTRVADAPARRRRTDSDRIAGREIKRRERHRERRVSHPDAVAVLSSSAFVVCATNAQPRISRRRFFGARGTRIVDRSRRHRGATRLRRARRRSGDVRRVRDAREPPSLVGGCSRASDGRSTGPRATRPRASRANRGSRGG